MVALIGRLRIANDMPLAIELSSLSSGFLPDPTAVSSSLYAELGKKNARPVRAIQRISACNVKEPEAGQLAVPVGAAGLSIDRISYLPSRRAAEFTRPLSRRDPSDFAAHPTPGESRPPHLCPHRTPTDHRTTHPPP